MFAFENRDSFEDLRGWSRLEWDVEFTRQGVGDEWHETAINKAYAVSKVILDHCREIILLLFAFALF